MIQLQMIVYKPLLTQTDQHCVGMPHQWHKTKREAPQLNKHHPSLHNTPLLWNCNCTCCTQSTSQQPQPPARTEVLLVNASNFGTLQLASEVPTCSTSPLPHTISPIASCSTTTPLTANHTNGHTVATTALPSNLPPCNSKDSAIKTASLQ